MIKQQTKHQQVIHRSNKLEGIHLDLRVKQNNDFAGYNYAKGEVRPELMVFCTRMQIFAEVAIATFSEEGKTFVFGLKNLSDQQRKRIISIIRYNLLQFKLQLKHNLT